MATCNLLAIDLGASSGRGILGSFDGEVLTLRETHRFLNEPISLNGRLYWDILRIFHEVKQAIAKTNREEAISSIGIDTWGVDYALLDCAGRMLANPVHYRDVRTENTPARIAPVVSDKALYLATGIQKMNFNTVYQLCEDLAEDKTVKERAARMLNIPDLLNYFLTGEMKNEYTVLSTGAILDPMTRTYHKELLEKLGIPLSWFSEPIEPGTLVGKLTQDVQSEVGKTDAKVFAVASHDTASAVIAVPTKEEDFVFISSGTWSLMGTELKAPLVNDKTRELNFTNEGGILGTTRFLKNIMGLWLIQESRRQWKREGLDVSFAEMEAAASEATPFASLIDPDDPAFGTPGDMPGKIRAFCKKTGQTIPESMGAVVRCIYESLALKYRMTADAIEVLRGRKNQVIHVVGGGTKDTFLSQMTADACGIPVIAGPVEATAIGNLLVQLMALGLVKTLADARALVARSFETKTYIPSDARSDWDAAYKKFRLLTDKK